MLESRRTMTGCASCLCASKTQQHVASWREAFSPGHYPSAARLRATTAADASAWATGGHDATTICAATAQGPPADHLQPMQAPLQHQPISLTQSSFGSQQGHAGPMIQGSTQHTMLPTQQAPPLQPMDPTTYGHSTQTPTPNYMPT